MLRPYAEGIRSCRGSDLAALEFAGDFLDGFFGGGRYFFDGALGGLYRFFRFPFGVLDDTSGFGLG